MQEKTSRGFDSEPPEPDPVRYRAVFLSDVHLGTRAAQAGALLDFLKHTDADVLYLVGDIIDFWRVRRGAHWPQAHNDVLQKLLRKACKGTRIVFIPGNHDEGLRDYCGARFGGMEIRRQAVHTTAAGRRYIVMHGDEFDVVVRYARWLAFLGDRGYELALWSNAPLNWVRRYLGFGYWHGPARRARHFPHRSAGEPAAGAASPSPARSLALRGAPLVRPDAAGSLGHLRRLPSLRTGGSRAMILASPAAAGMDRHYRYQRCIYDVTRRHYLLGRDTLIDGLVPPNCGSVLEIGCGTARNLVSAARRYPDARLFGIDISASMLRTAGRRISGAGLATRIRLAQDDATQFDTRATFGRADFDRVFVSYALSMIPGWQDVLERAVGAVAPQGSLHIVDFGRGEGLPRLARSALYTWLAHFSVTPRPDLEAVVRTTAARHGLDAFFTPMYRGYAAYGVLTRR
jgi:SAM-dependent methyltransferase